MLVFTSAVVSFRYFPYEAEKYGWGLAAALASVSNIYYFYSMNYFDASGETFPLIHTWSLAVEEQFYLLFPAAILLICKFGKNKIELSIKAMFLGSFIASSVLNIKYPAFDFYWIFTRAWELLLGSLLVTGDAPRFQKPWVAELAGVAGMALILASLVFCAPGMAHFPGFLAIFPCLGAALVLQSGRDHETLVARILSFRPLVFIGIISYSLYLWHWPMIAFQKADRLLIASDSKAVERSVVLAVSLVAATLSWWLVERPTRDWRRVPIRSLLAGFGALVLALACFAAFLIGSHGWPQRFPAQANRLADYMNYDFNPPLRVGHCLLSDRMAISRFDRQQCLPAIPHRPTYLIVGDSHAAALASGLVPAYHNANILQVTASGCLPIFGPQPLSAATSCEALMRFGLLELPRDRHLDGIWLFGRIGSGALRERALAMVDTAVKLRSNGLNVTIIGPNPEYKMGLPRLLAKAYLVKDPGMVEHSLAQDPLQADRVMRNQARRMGVKYISLIDLLCPDNACISQDGEGRPMLFDTDHFTVWGAQIAAERLRPALVASLTRLAD